MIVLACVAGVVGGYLAALLADAVGMRRYGPGTAGHDPEDAALAPLEAPTTGPQRAGAAVVGGAGLVALAAGIDDGGVVALYGALFLAWVAAMVVDLQFLRLPNVVTYGTAVVAFAGLAVVGEGVAYGGALVGAVAYAGFLLVARVGYQLVRGREGMGMGDIKLAIALGATAGWLGGAATDPPTIGALRLVIYAAIAGNLLGVAGGLVALRRVDRELPFGPALVLGWLLAVACADRLLG